MKRFVIPAVIIIMFAVSALLLYSALHAEPERGIWVSTEPAMAYDSGTNRGYIVYDGESMGIMLDRDGDFFTMYKMSKGGTVYEDDVVMTGYIKYFEGRLQLISDSGDFAATLHLTDYSETEEPAE